MGSRNDYIKTKYTGIHYTEDPKTKIKTYIARIKVAGIVDTEQVVGYSNDNYKTNAALAYHKRLELIQQAKNGKSIKSADNPTLNEYFEGYVESKAKALNEKWESVTRSFYNTRIPEILKNKKLKDIKTHDLQKVVNDMIDAGYTGRYIKSLKEVFGPMLEKALTNELIDSNPLAGVNFPSFDNKRKFYLPDEKIKALYHAVMNIPDDDHRLIFMFLMRGRRVNEVLSLEWQDIDLKAKKYRIRAENYKTRRSMEFLFDDDLLEHLKRYAESTSNNGFVFKSRINGEKMNYIPRRVWERIKKEVDIEDMTPHDFRHLVGFTLINNDVPIEIISKTLGHAQIATTQRYSNMKEEMAKKGVDAFLGLIKS